MMIGGHFTSFINDSISRHASDVAIWHWYSYFWIEGNLGHCLLHISSAHQSMFLGLQIKFPCLSKIV